MALSPPPALRPAVRRWLAPRRTALVLLPLLLAGAAAAVHRTTGMFWGDFAVYQAGAVAAARGDGQLYEVVHQGTDGIALGFTYPPFAALLLQPLAPVDPTVGVGLWLLASVVALSAVVAVALRAAGVAASAGAVLTGTVAMLPVFPVAGHLQVGQVGLFLMLIVLVDLLHGPGRRWHGLGVGVAAGVKLTPLIFVAYLVCTGRWRAAGVALAGFAATIGLGFAWRPADSARFWGGGLLDTARVTGDPRTVLNQSLHGALARLADTADVRAVWLPVAALTAVAGLVIAARCARAGEPLLGVIACATTGLLVSPVSWHHHWVWCVPALVLLVVRGRRTGHRLAVPLGVTLWAGYLASAGWTVIGLRGTDLHFQGWELLHTNMYVLVGVAALGWLARRPSGAPVAVAPIRPRPAATPAAHPDGRDGATVNRADTIEGGIR
ncbi:glycosyltransferase 87 family protein [Micromonospora andamanensis]|uniref:glycosyltransferase 87 family protein n=1 Tax=Micromonospora andamanensis TaxID=1287068 RepID=UPI0019522D37|nr:glycosyltransferase 87 family protein [Micromonospora andamanensis]